MYCPSHFPPVNLPSPIVNPPPLDIEPGIQGSKAGGFIFFPGGDLAFGQQIKFVRPEQSVSRTNSQPGTSICGECLIDFLGRDAAVVVVVGVVVCCFCNRRSRRFSLLRRRHHLAIGRMPSKCESPEVLIRRSALYIPRVVPGGWAGQWHCIWMERQGGLYILGGPRVRGGGLCLKPPSDLRPPPFPLPPHVFLTQGTEQRWTELGQQHAELKERLAQVDAALQVPYPRPTGDPGGTHARGRTDSLPVSAPGPMSLICKPGCWEVWRRSAFRSYFVLGEERPLFLSRFRPSPPLRPSPLPRSLRPSSERRRRGGARPRARRPRNGGWRPWRRHARSLCGGADAIG